MNAISDFLLSVGQSSLDLFWKPLVAWTLFALPVFIGLHFWRKVPALVQYHAHVALLLALPLSVALAPFVSWPVSPEAIYIELPAPLPEASPDALPVFKPEAVIPIEVTPTSGWTWIHMVGLMFGLAMGMALVLSLRTLYLARRLRRFRTYLSEVDDPDALRRLHRLRTHVGVKSRVLLATTEIDVTPMTFGWLKPVIVLPAQLLQDKEALRLTLIHELIHIRRRDFPVGSVVRWICLIFAVHPGVWILKRRIEQYREISCDAEALVTAHSNVRQYANLLLRFSPLTGFSSPLALRMIERDSILKQRMIAMKNSVFSSPTAAFLRRMSLPIAAVLLIGSSFIAACTSNSTRSETVIVSPEADVDVPVDLEFHEQQRLAEEMQIEAERARVVDAELQALERARREQEADGIRDLKLREELIQKEHRLKEILEQEAHNVKVREIESESFAQKLRRLDLQMAYLKAEIKEAAATLGPQSKEGGWTPSDELTFERIQLLRSMYMQRMEQYETLKMEQFTREALSDNVRFDEK